MKRYIYLTAVAALFTLYACNRVDESEVNFDNVVYLDNAKVVNTERIALKERNAELERTINAALALPESRDVRITLKADSSLVSVYRKIKYEEAKPLPAEYYELSTTQAVIPAGLVMSSDITVLFKGLQGLAMNTNFVLPVTLESADGAPILNGSKTIYYVLRKGATITTAVNTEENYFEFPTAPNSDVLDGLTNITIEGLLRARDFSNSVSTFLGVEGYALIRVRDAAGGHVTTDPQFFDTWMGYVIGLNKWLHLAFTINTITGERKLYVNGALEETRTGSTYPTGVNLGKKLVNHTTNKFYIGFSYEDTRDFKGNMSEVRIWNVIRTEEEIASSMYEVEPDTPGLVAYWKMDEGSGNTIKDYTGNGLNGIAKNQLKWISVELPE
ncbi:MAG: DUF1735 and LamG domain-containing protein [Prevotellaceae bacterium]|jgi:hypothetical protein|nr:DUF1735 and LamG domain-containing protein [Prevotellaceae bacterium]